MVCPLYPYEGHTFFHFADFKQLTGRTYRKISKSRSPRYPLGVHMRWIRKKAATVSVTALFLLVPGARLELARCCHRRILSPLRLPIPPSRRVEAVLCHNVSSRSSGEWFRALFSRVEPRFPRRSRLSPCVIPDSLTQQPCFRSPFSITMRHHMFQSLGTKTFILPTPVFLVGTYDHTGRPNIMTAAWGGICASSAAEHRRFHPQEPLDL